MKLFLDRNKTLLPRVDSIYFLTRLMIFVTFGAYAIFGHFDRIDIPAMVSITTLFIAQLVVFAFALRGRFDLKLAYLSAICFDLIFIPLFIYFTGGDESSMFVLYYLTASVSAYVLTFWYAATVAVIITASYFGLWTGSLQTESVFGFAMRIGAMWVVFLVISYVSDYLRRSEVRLIKLFDTLNMRTAELEKSQAQLAVIYENTRTMAALLEPDAVVREVMQIMNVMLGYQHCAMIFSDKSGEFYWRARTSGGHTNFHLKAIPHDRTELVRKVFNLQEPIRLKDVAERPDYAPLQPTSRSLALVPMIAHRHTVGLLVAESDEAALFKDRDIQQLTIVARSAALAQENAELHKRTAELTIIDELTDTFNYRYFVQKFQEEKKRALRYKAPLSIIMVDIDWFKKLNDSYGHEVGNVVLRELSRVIKGCVRDVDIFCRYGGEEFVVILPQTPQSEAAVIGERIRSQIENTVVDTGKTGKVKVTVSVGISSYPENGKSHEDLVSVADQALYRAKGSGKNLVCIV
ncbi:MAG: sensor domain-containing diguanylate cyclase [candidate division Zixibacteria bacterium]|nr:sensor domain-containing diguanylate cyclase [candidate division Zixibacteria bacterium]